MFTFSHKAKFNGPQILLEIRAGTVARLKMAAIYFQQKVREKVSRQGNATNKRSVARHGLIRSKPGEPPMRQTGFMRQNVLWSFDSATLTATVGIGRNAIYSVYLEEGNKSGTLKARPHWITVWHEQKAAIENILAGRRWDHV